MKRLLATVATLFSVAGLSGSAPAQAMPLDQVVSTLQAAHGVYGWGRETLDIADCSGLVSVAQSLAMGMRPQRFGNTDTLLSGNWPHAIPGASEHNSFIIGTNKLHMTARINGVNIESTAGLPWRFGSAARSPWSFPNVYHIDEAVI